MRRTAAAIALLVCAVAVGVVAAPAGAQDAGNETNGTTGEAVVVEATLDGTTATNVSGIESPRRLTKTVATELGIEQRQVVYVGIGDEPAIEVRAAGVTSQELADAIAASNASVAREDVRPGVTEVTRTQTARTLDARLNRSRYNGSVVRVEPDRVYVRVTPAPNATVLDRLFQRGEVTVTAYRPDGQQAELFTERDVRRTIPILVQENFSVVPVGLTAEGAKQFSSELRRLNFTQAGVASCAGSPNVTATGWCLETSLNGEAIARYGFGPDLADSVEAGVFSKRQFHGVITQNATQARALRLAALTGATPVDVTVTSVDDADSVEIEKNWPPDTDGNDTDGNDTDGNDTDGNDTDDSESTTTPAPTTATNTTANGTNGSASGSDGTGFTPLLAVLAVAAALLVLRRSEA